jgi:hypothetical protein
MKIYWSLYDAPEFSGLHYEEAQRVIKKYARKSFFHWTTLVSLGLLLVIVILGRWLGDWVFPGLSDVWKKVIDYTFAVIGALISYLTDLQLIRYLYRRDQARSDSGITQ